MRYEFKHDSDIRNCCTCNAELDDVPYIEAVNTEFEAFACCSEVCAMTLPHLAKCVHGEEVRERVSSGNN